VFTGFWCGIRSVRNYLEHIVADGRILLKWASRKIIGVDSFDLDQNTDEYL